MSDHKSQNWKKRQLHQPKVLFYYFIIAAFYFMNFTYFETAIIIIIVIVEVEITKLYFAINYYFFIVGIVGPFIEYLPFY